MLIARFPIVGPQREAGRREVAVDEEGVVAVEAADGVAGGGSRHRKVNGEEADDLGLALWGLDKTLHRFFDATGPDLSRARFMATLRSGREFASNILPPVHYSPGHPFGASQAHVLEADCSSRTFKTRHTFVSAL